MGKKYSNYGNCPKTLNRIYRFLHKYLAEQPTIIFVTLLRQTDPITDKNKPTIDKSITLSIKGLKYNKITKCSK